MPGFRIPIDRGDLAPSSPERPSKKAYSEGTPSTRTWGVADSEAPTFRLTKAYGVTARPVPCEATKTSPWKAPARATEGPE